MIQFPQYGLMPRWPEDGQGFIHPDDVPLVTRLIPSERVLRRDSFDGTYYHYRYGDFRFRMRPALWLPIRAEGLDLGDEVETVGVGMERELFIGVVTGMYYVRRKARILYRLRRGETTLRKLFVSDHLRLLTQKRRVREGDVQHPMPQWNGAGDRIDVLDE